MFFDSWFGVGRVLLVGAIAYVALIAILRISGKRTLSKFNAFDFVITVALGSTLATVLLSKDVALAEGLAALLLLVSLQYMIAWLSVRSKRFQQLVKSEPTMVFYQGRFLQSELVRQRISEEEVTAALRGSGLGSLEETGAVILETDGSISVLPLNGPGSDDALNDVGNLQSVRTEETGR